jgi:hypothetical protein
MKDLVDAAQQVRLDVRLKLDRKKRANLECGAIDNRSSSDDSPTSEGESNNSPSRDRKVSGKGQKKQNTVKGPQPEQDSIEKTGQVRLQQPLNMQAIAVLKRDRNISGRTASKQSTIGPLDLIAHCANNSYRHM